MKLNEIPVVKIGDRPMILFPEGWSEGWADPDIADGMIPLTVAEAYMAKASFPTGQRHTFPFIKIAEMTAPRIDGSGMSPYYQGTTSYPFGYSDNGKPLAPHGMSSLGVPKPAP